MRPIAEVNACAWCGELEDGHAQWPWQQHGAFHVFLTPSDELRKHRLLARRAARLGRDVRLVQHHARLATLDRLTARLRDGADSWVRQLRGIFPSSGGRCGDRRPMARPVERAPVALRAGPPRTPVGG